jgi:tetratricopeptide (TPR) repeat protein
MRSLSGASLTLGSLGLAATIGCSQVGMVQARRDFKAANAAYQQQDYKRAAELYEQTLSEDPSLVEAYFFLGNSYDNQFKPSRRGDATNDGMLDKAVKNYEIAADKLSAGATDDQKKLGKLSLEYLQAAYGVDKLNDPAKAEPIVQKMIRLEPGEPSNYFVLAKIYEDAGVYDEAERTLMNAKLAKPSDPAVYMTLAGYYNRQGQFDKTIEALEERSRKEPNNPEAFYTISVYYWEKAYRDFKLTEKEKRAYVDKGEAAVDQALKIKPDYVEAIVYKGLLLRLQATLEKDAGKQQSLIKEAETLSAKAADLRKQKAAGVSQ